jgi:uncharacterized membrane protein YeaQ/YmgE (transglycosylase-associated protein family)
MSGVGLLGAIIVGILAGWIAEQILKRRHGLLTNLVVGVLGAILGGFLANMLGISFAGIVGSLIISSIGAILLLLILDVIKGRRSH